MKCLTNLTDQQLIHLYVDGDSDAFSTIVLRYKEKIFTSIYLLVKDKKLIAQLAFLKSNKNYAQFQIKLY